MLLLIHPLKFLQTNTTNSASAKGKTRIFSYKRQTLRQNSPISSTFVVVDLRGEATVIYQGNPSRISSRKHLTDFCD